MRSVFDNCETCGAWIHPQRGVTIHKTHYCTNEACIPVRGYRSPYQPTLTEEDIENVLLMLSPEDFYGLFEEAVIPNQPPNIYEYEFKDEWERQGFRLSILLDQLHHYIESGLFTWTMHPTRQLMNLELTDDPYTYIHGTERPAHHHVQSTNA